MKNNINYSRPNILRLPPGEGRGAGARRFRTARLHTFNLSFQIPNSEFRIQSRSGSTLTEVLVALMIMSIGLVSVATLFPLSILRSVKATQITQATDARFNAESMIALFPQMLSLGGTPSTFIVDPLGYAIMNNSGVATTAALAPYFGNDPSLPVPGGPPAAAGSWNLRRYPYITMNGNANDLVAADKIVTMPDSWILQSSTIGGTLGGAVANTKITLTGTLATASATAPYPTMRIVMLSADGTTSQARNITKIDTTTTAGSTIVYWTEDFDGDGTINGSEVDVNQNGTADAYALPTNFVTNGIGLVRIETQDRRYTWLLTVRRDASGSSDVDVVVFFGRKFSLDDEQMYSAVFTTGSPQVTVNYTAGSPPFMQPGSFIFDGYNCYWYRISSVPADPNPGTSTSRTIMLDVPANAGNQTAAQIYQKAMLPRAIVDVYPIGKK